MKAGKLALAELPVYREYAHGRDVLYTVYTFDIVFSINLMSEAQKYTRKRDQTGMVVLKKSIRL